MPIIRIIPGRESPKRIGEYIRQNNKTDEKYIFASNCDPFNPEWDFQVQEKSITKISSENIIILLLAIIRYWKKSRQRKLWR